MNDKLNIKIGKAYDAYHDGKKSPSRLTKVIIDEVIPIMRLNNKAVWMWKRAIEKDFKEVLIDRFIHYIPGPQRFWDWNCDVFLVGHIQNDPETVKDPILFARRPRGWYGVNWNYMLDVAGKIRKANIKDWKLCAEECNQIMKWNRKEGKYDYFDMLTKKKVSE